MWFTLSQPVQTDIPIEDQAIARLAPLTNLRELRIDRTKIKGRSLAPFTRLEILDLSYAPIDDEGLRALAGMPNLTRLYLRDTLVTDEGLRYLQELRRLTELDLAGARLTDAGLPYLKNLTALTRLNLLGAAVTDQGLENLAGLTRHDRHVGLEEARQAGLVLEQSAGGGLEGATGLGALLGPAVDGVAGDVRVHRAGG